LDELERNERILVGVPLRTKLRTFMLLKLQYDSQEWSCVALSLVEP
jgi:hypothetical protein